MKRYELFVFKSFKDGFLAKAISINGKMLPIVWAKI